MSKTLRFAPAALFAVLSSINGCSCSSDETGDPTSSAASSGGTAQSSAATTGGGAVCGDGAVDPGEGCDDGNTDGGDGCSAMCQTETDPVCGDGAPGPDEACDDGNALPFDGCEDDCTLSPDEVVCEELAPLPSGTCEVTPGDGSKLIAGTVLAPHTVLRGGQVLVDAAGVIQCVACDCEAMAAGATRITCPRGVVSPGLINTHDHITFTQNDPYTDTGERYEHRHDWRAGKNGHTEINTAGQASDDEIRWGELRFLLGGATSIVGSGSASGLLRNLDRAEQEGLGQEEVHFETFPLGDSNSTQLAQSCGYPDIDTQQSIAMDDAYLPHVAEGIDAFARNEFICVSGTESGGEDLLEPQSAFIHAVGLGALDYARMAHEGTSLIWSPRSNVTLYGDTAVVTAAARLGVLIALGTDWVATGSMNMLRELRCADDLNAGYYDGYFTDRQLWQMVTYNAARATATDDAIGALQPALVGDIAIFDGAAAADHRAIIDGEPKDVALVLRGGKPLYGDGALIAAIPSSGACDALDVCGAAKSVCLSGDIGETLPQLESSVGAIYPAFFCGAPEKEPSCTPTRPVAVNGSSIYSGAATPGDGDGDGVADATDLCPAVFNPIRPVDGGAQADFDGDGDGDACDPCPITPSTTVCAPFDPDDIDGDGVPNAGDNCPGAPNAGQEDGDSDDKGDLCDPCPADTNPGAAGCPATIYEIKTGVATGAVSLSNALVTGCAEGRGIFLQVKPGDPGYAGPEHSGVFVYVGASLTCNGPAALIDVGDRVDIPSATVADFFGQIQLGQAMVVVIASAGEAPPPPVVVSAGEVATGGAKAAELEGVIVQVDDVVVTSVTPPLGPGDVAPSNEFVVAGSLRVNDYLFLTTPLPPVGQAFVSIAGILDFRNGDSKLEPRSAADLAAGPPKLAGLSPASTFAREGALAAPTFPAPLTVSLTGPAQGDTFVAIASSDPASLAVVGGGVTILAGSSSAPVIVDGLLQAPSVILTATYDGDMAAADVRVLGALEQPVLAAIDPPAASVTPGGSVDLTVTLDIPAPPGGTVVDLAVLPATAGAVPATVTVPADQLGATFSYTDAGTDPGATVTASLAGDTVSSVITVVASLGGLVLNEIDYDQVGADGAEFVEIWNGSSGPIDLAGFRLVFVNGSSSAQYLAIELGPAGTLAAGQYLVVGGSAVTATVPAGALTITNAAAIQNGSPDAVGILDVAQGTLADALSYEGSVTAGDVTGVGPLSFVEGTALPLAVADVNDAPGSLIRSPDGADTDDAAADWAFTTTLTPGAANAP